MKIEKINSSNYNKLIFWYSGWNLPITPLSYIPETSIIVDDICAGFIYQLEKTPMWWIEGVISNPEIKDKALKKEALSVLITELTKLAKEKNAELILSSTPRESLNTIFLSNEFKNTPEKYFHVARFI